MAKADLKSGCCLQELSAAIKNIKISRREWKARHNRLKISFSKPHKMFLFAVVWESFDMFPSEMIN